MVERKVIKTDKAAAALAVYSQGISMDGWLFVSGQIGLHPETGEMSPEFGEQARQSLENLKQIVIAGGCGLGDVVAVDVFLTDMAKFAEFNEIYKDYFNEDPPARAAIQVAGLPAGALVEVKCIAHRP